MKNLICTLFLVTLGIFINGCLPQGAGLEWGHVPSGTFADPNWMPPFGSQMTDGWGILYTLQAGSFDPDHRSGTARRTYHNHKEVYPALIAQKKEISMRSEGSTDRLEFEYPSNWNKISTDEKKEMALQVAEYVAFNSMVWHEMLSWYHARLFAGMDDFESAFSWEDVFCDLYGAKVAVQAIKMGGDFEDNVTKLTKEQLDQWQVVSMARAKEITDSVKGKWWKRTMPSLHSNILMRGMDIGCDGFITAALIPGFYDGTPASLAVPKLDLLDRHGLKMKYTITSSYSSQTRKLKELAGQDTIEPRKDFCTIIEEIQRDAESRPGFLVIR